MASVTLTTLWLNVASDLSDYMSFPQMNALTDAPMVPWSGSTSSTSGQVRLYADGTLRAVVQPGYQKSVTVTLYGCTPAQVAWLDLQNQGNVTLLARDDVGRRFYCSFYTYSAVRHPYDANADVTLTLLQMSGTDQV